MRKLLITLPFIGLTVFVGVGPTKVGLYGTSAAKVRSTVSAQDAQDPVGTIDGAVTPDLIPDDVAYEMFFFFVADRATRDEIGSLKSYLRQHRLDHVNFDALVRVSNDYRRASKAMDEVGGSTGQDVRMQRKAALVIEKIASLQVLLGSDGADSVRRHVTEYMKTKIKIVPGMLMPPSSNVKN